MTDIAGTILDAQRNDGPSPKAAGSTRRGSCATRRRRGRRCQGRGQGALLVRGLERDPLRRGDPRRARAGPARLHEGPGARADADAGDRPRSAAHRRRGERVDLLALRSGQHDLDPDERQRRRAPQGRLQLPAARRQGLGLAGRHPGAVLRVARGEPARLA